MIARLFLHICRISSFIRRLVWHTIYQLVNAYYKNNSWNFINYGYSDTNTLENYPKLSKKDEQNRSFIQLYCHAMGDIALANAHVLEVGCGRGGGAAFIKTYLHPKKITGLDYSKANIEFCKRKYRHENISFIVGDAERLPCTDISFDAIINIESSHCYGSKEKFFSEACRVLKPGGYFFYADICLSHQYTIIDRQISKSGFRIVRKLDITPNVIKAITEDGERRFKIFKNNMSKFFLHYFQEFAGNKSSSISKMLKNGEMIYYSYIAYKPDTYLGIL